MRLLSNKETELSDDEKKRLEKLKAKLTIAQKKFKRMGGEQFDVFNT